MDSRDALIAELRKEIAKLKQLVLQQSAEIAELKRRFNKNSGNSSKPPSSDGLGKSTKPRSSRQKSTFPSGGQQGHRGRTLKQVSSPDVLLRHRLSECPNCAGDLRAIAVAEVSKRQVFELPKPQLEVTEHQVERKRCPCCQHLVSSAFPANVKAPVQYGPRLQSYAVYLSTQQLLPEGRLQQIFSDLFNVELSTATLHRFNTKVAEHLSGFIDEVLNTLREAPVKHLDETGFRVMKKTQWLHVCSNALWTYYHHSSKRKCLLDGLQGTVVHDHWRPYYQLPKVAHSLCNAHHLRELQALMDDKERWAHQMHRLLRVGLAIKHHYGGEGIPSQKQQRWLAAYDALVARGLAYHEALPIYRPTPARGRVAKRPGHNLAARLKHYRDDVTRFIKDINTPFTNNQAEQDLRMMKLKQKISGCFRAHYGATQFLQIRAFISTARKQQWNIIDAITKAVYAPVNLETYRGT